MDFYKIYKPITAAPFIHDRSHVEIEPCDALKPYIRCFWGSQNSYVNDKADILAGKLLIPDTCMDVVFRINFTDNRLDSDFCGINDGPLSSESENIDNTEKSVFGIRFYAWSAVLFSEESMKDVKNGFFDSRQHFSKLTKDLEQRFFDVVDFNQRVKIAEDILLRHLNKRHSNPFVMEAVGEILRKKGNLKFLELWQEMHISERQMERLFKEYMGVSPKIFSSLIRYQYLWKDIFFNPVFNIQDGVFQYGYTDQSHLLHDFKRFHTMNMEQAREYAFQNVGFLQ